MIARLEALRIAAGRLSARGLSLATALEAGDVPDATRAAGRAALEALAEAARAAALATLSRQPAHLTAADVRLRRARGLLEAMCRGVAEPHACPTIAEDAPAATGAARTDDAPIDAGPRSDLSAHVGEVAGEGAVVVLEVRRALEAVTERADERSVVPMAIDPRRPVGPATFASSLSLSRHVEPMLVRFAARLAALLVLGILLLHVAGPGQVTHPHWLPLTILVLAQPDYGATRQRAVQRFAGTLVGSLVASGVLMLHLPLWALVLALGACGFVFSFFMRRRYAVAVGFLTVMVVLLVETAHPITIGVSVERLTMTALGGAMTLVATSFFWPHWERARYSSVLAEALRANRDFLRTVARRLAAGGAYGPDDVAAKRTAEVANAAALASLGRLYADPANRRGDVERAAAMLEGNRRLTRLFNLLLLQSLRRTRDDAAGDAGTSGSNSGASDTSGASAALGAFAGRAGRRLDAFADAVLADARPTRVDEDVAAAATGALSRPAAIVVARAEAELNAMDAALSRRRETDPAATGAAS